MCDACGCAKASAFSPRPRKAGGWHVHADGTVHRHDGAEVGHEHSDEPNAGPRAESSTAYKPVNPPAQD